MERERKEEKGRQKKKGKERRGCRERGRKEEGKQSKKERKEEEKEREGERGKDGWKERKLLSRKEDSSCGVCPFARNWVGNFIVYPTNSHHPPKGWACSHCPGSEQPTFSPGRSTEPSPRMLWGTAEVRRDVTQENQHGMVMQHRAEKDTKSKLLSWFLVMTPDSGVTPQ